MIVIFCDNIDDFIIFLEKRIMNEIFYEFKGIKNQVDLSSKIYVEIILHFLAKVSDTLILYETKQNLAKSKNSTNNDEIIQTLQKIFHGVDPSLKLVLGKIREIFLSYSS
ncbi:hypothetical protein LCGC14_1138530 [marine sediment metagenome]|uniref:Uncharacterized protein n=1 Tax=marine sediment metagenome TaxID=412755 RepID=A0A0F9MLX4_9ZZZZ